MDLSICIVTYNQPTLLPNCVEACLSEIGLCGVTAEVIVIDNASRDSYPARLSGHSPLVRVIRNEENLSFSAANNRAIRSSQGRYVLILNDDAVLQKGSLAAMVRELDRMPDAGAIGPKLIHPDRSLQSRFTNRRFPHIRGIVISIFGLEGRLVTSARWRDLLTLSRDPECSGETDYVAGACLLIRRTALLEVGLFDEDFSYWFEDTDFCYRLKKRGWKVFYQAETSVIHYGSASLNKIDESHRTMMFLRSLMIFYAKDEGPIKSLLLRFFLGAALLCNAFRISLRCLYSVGSEKGSDSFGRLLTCLRLLRLVYCGAR
ncbi:MAG TPA: glycosyltransferase family 2 protein [Candidatus Eisenbacteria bacterium]|nr:glycosyltransferase family 2 protein [Candidatus Eisenbacteria bacterium]